MPNITPTNAAPFIPEVWGNMALGRLAGNLVLAGLVNRDWADIPGQQGDILNIPKRGAVTVAQKALDTDLVFQAPAASTIQVVLDRHYAAGFRVEDVARAQAGQEIGEGYAQDAATALAEEIEKDGLTKAYTGFTANAAIGVAGTAANDALVLSAFEALANAKIPQNVPKYVIWSVKDVKALLGIAKFTEADKLGDQGSTLRTADLGQLYGMRHIMSQYVPVTAGAPNDTHNVAFAPDALTLAMRPLPAPRAGAQSFTAGGAEGTSTEGLGIRLTISYDAKALAEILTVDALWGWAVVRNEFGLHVHA
jgi:hypothetical protein